MNTQTHIVQHNAITTARYEYNETQLNLFFFLLSKVRADNKDGVYSITLNELSKMTGREHQPAHIKSTLEEMVGRYFHIEKPDGWMLLLVFQSIQYVNGEGRIIMKLTEDVRPYLHDLKANFTKFQLYSALRLRSKHAKRIYTLCSQWKAKGETPRYDLLTFKEMLGLYDSQTGEEKLKVINSFETRVLKEAVSQINELTDLRISYEMKKEGRAFKWLWFTIKAQELAVPISLDNPQAAAQGPMQVNFLDDLIQKIENRQDCPLNGSELRTALSALLAWGASADLLNTFANNYEYLKRAKQYAYSVRMMDEKPVAPLAELIAELNI